LVLACGVVACDCGFFSSFLFETKVGTDELRKKKKRRGRKRAGKGQGRRETDREKKKKEKVRGWKGKEGTKRGET